MTTIVVTGATSGIGAATERRLAGEGHVMVLLARDERRGLRLRDALRSAGGRAELVVGDLAGPTATRAAGDALLDACPRVDVLIHNAGIWPTALRRTPEGLEEGFAVNHLAPFLLSSMLEERLAASGGRVVQVSAGLYVKGRVDLAATPTGGDYHWMRTYATTKACNLMLVPLWAERWADRGITIDAVHPGVIRTNLGARTGLLGVVTGLIKRTWASPEEGAGPVARLATAPPGGGDGRYFDVDAEAALAPPADDTQLAVRVWTQAAELCAVGAAVPSGR